MSELYNLDGKDNITPTPFDAHEQVVRGPHTHVPIADPTLAAHKASGYKAADYEHQEFPKAVAHDEVTGAPVLVNSAGEEAAYNQSLRAEESPDGAS